MITYNLQVMRFLLLLTSPMVTSSEHFGYSECVYHTYKAVCMGEYEALTMENRGLSTFPSISSTITCVKLRKNYIDQFPEDLDSLKNVVTMDIAANRISYLPDNLEKMQKLEILDVSENRLEMLSSTTKFPASLRGLLLAKNKMKTIPMGIVVPGLFVLDLSGNMFTDLPEQFCMSDQLIRVDITKNPLRHDVSHYISTANRCKNVNEIPFCLFTDSSNIKCDCSSVGPIFGDSPSFCLGTPVRLREFECTRESEEIYRGQKLFDVNGTLVKNACPLLGQKSKAWIVRYSEMILISSLFLILSV